MSEPIRDPDFVRKAEQIKAQIIVYNEMIALLHRRARELRATLDEIEKRSGENFIKG